MHSSTNVLYDLRPYCITNKGVATAASTADVLVNGVIKIKSSTGVLNINNNSAIYWDLSSKFEEGYTGVNLANVKIFSSWTDTGRVQVKVSRIMVRTVEGGDEWLLLDNSSYTGAQSSMTYMAVFSNEDGSLLAENVTHLMIDFGTSQQNGFVGYSEIEAGVVLNNLPRFTLTVQDNPNVGTVTVNPSAENNSYIVNSEVVLTATPVTGAKFLRWFGNVPADEIYNNEITIKMDDLKTVNAVFAKDWEWSKNIMSDGYFKVTTSINNNNGMTISKVEALVSPAPVFDLRKPINGTAAIPVVINASVFNELPIRLLKFADTITHIGDSCRKMTSLEELVLPANLKTLGHCAFYNCTSLRKVEPLLPEGMDVAAGSSNQQFDHCPIRGSLVAGPGLTKISSYMFFGSSLTTVDLRNSSVASIGDSSFREGKSLTEVYFPKTLSTFGADAFYQCSALKSFYFESKPATFAAKAFEGVPTNMRIVVYKSDNDWMEYFSSCESLSTPTFTAWTNLTAKVQGNYTFNDECEPYGRVKIGSSGIEVFVATRRRQGGGLMIMLR